MFTNILSWLYVLLSRTELAICTNQREEHCYMYQSQRGTLLYVPITEKNTVVPTCNREVNDWLLVLPPNVCLPEALEGARVIGGNTGQDQLPLRPKGNCTGVIICGDITPLPLEDTRPAVQLREPRNRTSHIREHHKDLTHQRTTGENITKTSHIWWPVTLTQSYIWWPDGKWEQLPCTRWESGSSGCELVHHRGGWR